MPRVKKKAVKKSQYGSNMAAGAKKLKKGGKSKKNWIQGVNKSIKKRGTKGKCTPILQPAHKARPTENWRQNPRAPGGHPLMTV